MLAEPCMFPLKVQEKDLLLVSLLVSGSSLDCDSINPIFTLHSPCASSWDLPSSRSVSKFPFSFFFKILCIKVSQRDPWVAQRISACLWPRARSWRPGIESPRRAPRAWSLLLPLPMSLPLSLSHL